VPWSADQLPPDQDAQHLDRIRAYYDETWRDYCWLWLNRQNYAIHFGYWDAQTPSHAAALLNMNRVLAAAIGIQPGQRILDAGCGVGGSAIWLATTFGAEVVGITPVRSQVDRAWRHARAQGVADRVTFEQQDYRHTSFPDGSFDVVWALESVCHAPDKPAVLQEAQRLLRPGGRLGIIEYLRTARPHAPADERLLQRWLAGWAIPDLATGDELVAALGAVGFAGVRLVDITCHVQPSLRHLFWLATLLGPGESLLHTLGLRSERQHGNTRGACDQYRAVCRGLWYDGLLTAGKGPD
jgi:tocopherol O-methyltransferase